MPTAPPGSSCWASEDGNGRLSAPAAGFVQAACHPAGRLAPRRAPPPRCTPAPCRGRSTAMSISARSIVSAGARRMTVPWVSFVSTPRPTSVSQMRRALAKAGSISTPTKSPLPRMSTIRRMAQPTEALPAGSRPGRGARSARLALEQVPSAASPTAAARGLPPNVLPWSPGANTAITSSRAQNALTGRQPAAERLAEGNPSGRTPSWSQASRRPVRPRPVWTSSAIISTLCRVQISRTAAR